MQLCNFVKTTFIKKMVSCGCVVEIKSLLMAVLMIASLARPTIAKELARRVILLQVKNVFDPQNWRTNMLNSCLFM